MRLPKQSRSVSRGPSASRVIPRMGVAPADCGVDQCYYQGYCYQAGGTSGCITVGNALFCCQLSELGNNLPGYWEQMRPNAF